jgi:hypothetical protein
MERGTEGDGACSQCHLCADGTVGSVGGFSAGGYGRHGSIRNHDHPEDEMTTRAGGECARDAASVGGDALDEAKALAIEQHVRRERALAGQILLMRCAPVRQAAVALAFVEGKGFVDVAEASLRELDGLDHGARARRQCFWQRVFTRPRPRADIAVKIRQSTSDPDSTWADFAREGRDSHERINAGNTARK